MSEQNRTNQQSQEQTQPAPAKKEETRHAAPAWKKFLGKKMGLPGNLYGRGGNHPKLSVGISGIREKQSGDGGRRIDRRPIGDHG